MDAVGIRQVLAILDPREQLVEAVDRVLPRRVTSLRVVSENPITMFIWATFLLLATSLSLATFMLGFLLLYPLMGHASWHVYRDLVDVSGLPPRSGSE